MAGETVITVVGNLTGDPELRFTPSGAAVANFTIASTPRNFNRQTNEWEDGETLFLRGSAWRDAAENVAETLTKGMRVIAQGRLKSRSYETKEGERRTSMELDVDEIGPSLKHATAKVVRAQRQQAQQGQQGGFHGYGQGGGYGAPAGGPQQGGQGWGDTAQQGPPPGQQQPQQQQQQGWQQGGNPWGHQGQQGGGFGAPGNDEPPF